MAGNKLAPAKRKSNGALVGGQRRLSDMGVTVAVTRHGKLASNKELQRLGGPLGISPQQLKGAAQQGRGLRSATLTPTPAGQMPAGRGLASTSKAAKPPAGKTPAAKAPATAAKGPAPAPATKGKQAAAQHEGKAAAGKAAGKAKREMLAKFKHCGTTYEPGHTVYVVTDDSLVGRDLSEDEGEDFPCMVCGDTDTKRRVMLECDRCLGGCHLACCSPPLDDVPEGEWVCPECAAGKAPPARRATTARERFLQQQGLALARIEAIWREPGGDVECSFRWYGLPEDTHTGRQRHHLAREVFLLSSRDVASVECILRRAHVLPPREFGTGASSKLGEDVFVCEYQYDEAWQRFRRISEFESESDEEADDWAPASDSEEEGDDFNPSSAELLAEQGGLPGGASKRRRGGGGGGRGAINRRKQGGDDYLAQVGAMAVPEHARARRQRGGGAQGALAQARSVLTLTAVPRSLPCREAERRQISDFVGEVLKEDSGKCLYVSGIPGTGKTATVLEVMRAMKRKSEAGEAPPFQFVEINGLRLPSPQHAYSALYEALTGDRAGPQTAAAALEDMFSAGGGSGARKERRPCVVLVDEMDLLVNKTQTVLYNLFEWPGRKGSRLSIIGVANTMDLPERLHPRIGSRLAGRRVVFQPYSKDQLVTIVRSRLEGIDAFHPNSVEFIARRIANNSGDVRRCLELCRRAAEIAEEWLHRQQRQQDEQQQQAGSSSQAGGSSSPPAEQQETGIVKMKHVADAISEMFNTGHMRMLCRACRLEKLLLAAIYLETVSSGQPECLLIDAWERLRLLASYNQEPAYDFSKVLERAAELGAKRLIICDAGARRVRVKVALNVAANDVCMVLSSDPELPWLEQALSRATMAPVTMAE